MTTKHQPKRPYPDFPLFPHASGQWAKKIRGKMHYFGTDADAALVKYQEQRDDLQAGRTPRVPTDGLILRDLVNRYLTAKKRQLEAGELSRLAFTDYYQACESLLDFFGAGNSVAQLRPEDFERYRAKLAKTKGLAALGNAIVRTRMVFKFAFDNELIERPARFGTGFSKPNAKTMRNAKNKSGSRMIEVEDLRRILAAAKQPMKAMVFLGINSAFLPARSNNSWSGSELQRK